LRFAFVVAAPLLCGWSAATTGQPTPSPVQAAGPAVQEKVIAIIAEKMHVEKTKISRNTRLSEDLKMRRLEVFELWRTLEGQFSINVPNEQSRRFETVGQMVDLVVERLKSNGRDEARGPEPPSTPAISDAFEDKVIAIVAEQLHVDKNTINRNTRLILQR
jgi:acyl carrier protein